MEREQMKTPLGGAFDGSHDGADDHDGGKTGKHMLGPMQVLDAPMRHYGLDEEVDFAIVGVGAAGGVLAQRLARAGFRVVGFDAGPFWDTERDWVSDEAGSRKLYWNDLRITGGQDPLTLGSNNSGHGVGGSTVHWAAFAPRLHPSDFRTYSQDGVGMDWPISYDDLRPYYELMEQEMPVSGPYFPWGDPHSYAYGPHPLGAVGSVLVEGCTRLGIGVVAGGPVAILAGSRGDRPHCIYRGFCIQGCKVGAKATTLITHVPDAVAHGAEIRPECMVARVNLGAENRVTGVTYFDAEGHERTQRAKVVIVSGYSIETPRLLLNSACAGYETGLANSSGVVGRYLMAQAGNVVLGRFATPVRMYKAPPAHGMTGHFYETDASRGFARGFAVQTVGPEPITFAKEMITAKGAWGWGLRRVMMDYNHWCPLGLLGEILPNEDNRVTLDREARDGFGLPVAHVHFDLHDNDKRLMEFGVRTVTDILNAAGAEETVEDPRYAHLVGACRMGNDPRNSVVDRWGQSHDIANLFVMDGSVMPTQGSANPGLTVQALAARTADYLVYHRENILARERPKEGLGAPPIRYDLAQPDTWGAGMPRVRSRRGRTRLGAGGLRPAR
jgi:choline dehydrogenase-like flavoprotein